MIYMGIDASSSCTGLCVFNDRALVFYDKIKPKDKGKNYRENACAILEQVEQIVQRYKPDVIFMEDVPQFVRQGSHGGNLVKPLITLGCVQGVFYYELAYKLGYKIVFLDVYEWRKKLDFLKGERKRDKQKAKAVTYVNELFGLNLYYQEGKKSVKDDDDIAEAICLVISEIK